MVLLAQGKPGTLAQNHLLLCAKKDGEWKVVMEVGGRSDGGHDIKGRVPTQPMCLSEYHTPLLHASCQGGGALQH